MSVPKRQVAAACASSRSLRVMRKSFTDASIAPTAMPTSTSRSPVVAVRELMRCTANAVAKPPTTVPRAMDPAEEGAAAVDPVTRIATSPPVAAPVLKPMTSGLPSGLRETLWNTMPLRPSAAPTATAHATRGSRWSATMKRACASPPPSRASSACAGDSG